jgi:hypothetical protein
MPTAAGIFSILSGFSCICISIVILFGMLSITDIFRGYDTFDLVFLIYALLSLKAAILAITGGIFSIMRRAWGLSFAGAISGLFCGSCLCSILSIIFLSLSKKEF